MIVYDDELRERLRTNLASFEPRHHQLDGRRHAAVSVIVLDSDAQLHGVDTAWRSLPEHERTNRLDMVPGLPPGHVMEFQALIAPFRILPQSFSQ